MQIVKGLIVLKFRWKLFYLILAVIIAISGCGLVTRNEAEAVIQINEKLERSLYTINCELNPKDRTLSAVQEVDYYNNDDIEMNELYFHVYPNAFKNEDTTPFLFDDFDNAYKRGFEPGCAEILSVTKINADGRKLLKYSLLGEGETILKVELDIPLKPNDRVSLKIDFKLQIPPAGERFGYGDNNFNLGNWYPVAAVYDKKDGWNLDKYYAIGDPFYTDASDYKVTIKAPNEYTIAASGNFIEKKIEGNMSFWVFEEDALRDFAFIANRNFEVLEKEVEGINIKSYYYKGDEERGKEALETGVKAIKLFNKLYGKYPYEEFSIVETEFPSGMEYPALVYISDKLYKPDYNSDPLIITIVHETAHQWFYGIVGNDQIDEAWLDEGFAAYSETLFAERTYGKKTGESYYSRTVEDSVKEALSSNTIDGSVLKSLSEFEGWSDYGPTAYDRGAQILHELRKILGDDTFFKIIKSYVEQYKFKIATTEDFVRVCEEVSGKDLTDFFKPWFNGN